MNRWCCKNTRWTMVLIPFILGRCLNARRSYGTNSFTHVSGIRKKPFFHSWRVRFYHSIIEVHCLDCIGNFCEFITYSKHRLRLTGDFQSCVLIAHCLKYSRGSWFSELLSIFLELRLHNDILIISDNPIVSILTFRAFKQFSSSLTYILYSSSNILS